MLNRAHDVSWMPYFALLCLAGCSGTSSSPSAGGGANVAGATGTGGSPVTTAGGAPTSGTISNTAGHSGTNGGDNTGGSAGLGGGANIGGALSTGGHPATGGTSNAGGESATGGALAGGTDSTGASTSAAGGSTSAAGAPSAPPAPICDNTKLLSGPVAAPTGATTVPAGDNSTLTFGTPNETFWFAPGVHTLGNDQFSQIIPGNNATFIGAPGAIIDGQGINRYAFTQHATGVRVAYLEIRNFVSPNDEGVVNHDGGLGWLMEYNYMHDNQGAAAFVSTNNVLRYNCIRDNGQYGFQGIGPGGGGSGLNLTIDHNEVVHNDTGPKLVPLHG